MTQHIDVTGTHKFSRMSDEELLAILNEPSELLNPSGTKGGGKIQIQK